MPNDFQRRYRAALSQHNAAKRRGKHRKKGPWDKQYLGMIKQPKGEPDEENHEDGGGGGA